LAIRRLVEEFVGSGLTRSAFCLRHGMSLNTLKRYLARQSGASGESDSCRGLVAVEVAAAVSPARARRSDSGLAVVLSSGHRIEVTADFDAPTLMRLVNVLEGL
jgi:transposase-like protein